MYAKEEMQLGQISRMCVTIRSRHEIRNAELFKQSCLGEYSAPQIGLFPPKLYSYVNITEVNVFRVWTVRSFLSLCS